MWRGLRCEVIGSGADDLGEARQVDWPSKGMGSQSSKTKRRRKGINDGLIKVKVN